MVKVIQSIKVTSCARGCLCSVLGGKHIQQVRVTVRKSKLTEQQINREPPCQPIMQHRVSQLQQLLQSDMIIHLVVFISLSLSSVCLRERVREKKLIRICFDIIVWCTSPNMFVFHSGTLSTGWTKVVMILADSNLSFKRCAIMLSRRTIRGSSSKEKSFLIKIFSAKFNCKDRDKYFTSCNYDVITRIFI